MAKYGYTGAIPSQALSDNDGIFSVNEIVSLRKQNKFGTLPPLTVAYLVIGGGGSGGGGQGGYYEGGGAGGAGVAIEGILMLLRHLVLMLQLKLHYRFHNLLITQLQLVQVQVLVVIIKEVAKVQILIFLQ